MSHNFNGTNNLGNVVVNGDFDINVWYSYDNDTKTQVCTRKFSYSEKMNVPLKNDSVLDNNSEIIVRSLRQPTVTNVEIKDGLVELNLEKELGVEVVGNTKMRVSVEDLDDDYEEIIDEEIIDNEVNEVNEDYLNTKE